MKALMRDLTLKRQSREVPARSVSAPTRRLGETAVLGVVFVPPPFARLPFGTPPHVLIATLRCQACQPRLRDSSPRVSNATLMNPLLCSFRSSRFQASKCGTQGSSEPVSAFARLSATGGEPAVSPAPSPWRQIASRTRSESRCRRGTRQVLSQC